MREPKRRWHIMADHAHGSYALHTFTARGRLKAERKACRRLTTRYGNLVAHGLLTVRLEQDQ